MKVYPDNKKTWDMIKKDHPGIFFEDNFENFDHKSGSMTICDEEDFHVELIYCKICDGRRYLVQVPPFRKSLVVR